VHDFDGGLAVNPFKVTLNFTRKSAKEAFSVSTKE